MKRRAYGYSDAEWLNNTLAYVTAGRGLWYNRFVGHWTMFWLNVRSMWVGARQIRRTWLVNVYVADGTWSLAVTCRVEQVTRWWTWLLAAWWCVATRVALCCAAAWQRLGDYAAAAETGRGKRWMTPSSRGATDCRIHIDKLFTAATFHPIYLLRQYRPG